MGERNKGDEKNQMANVSLVNVEKTYSNGFRAVKRFNLEIRDGEFIIFVGPSGCGKSTTMRMIAGLEEISSGELWIDGQLANFLEPGQRQLSMVFQNYALYPYMSVYENMAFGLRVHKVDRSEIDRKVRETARLLQIDHLLDRRPSALSGGQKQRVAIGSVLVREPKLLLMDEPLSNLDAKLRSQMRVELAKIHERFSSTIVYVTHDQVEAMTLADRIVVMREGEIQQIASPNEIYNNPINQFVAGFIGSPSMNFLPVRSGVENGNYFLQAGKSRLLISDLLAKRIKDQSGLGKELVLGIRPEDLHLQKEEKTSADRIEKEKLGRGQNRGTLQMKVMVREGLGAEVLLHGEIEGENACVKLDPSCETRPGEMISLYPDMTKIKLFDAQTGDNLLYMNLKNEKR